MQRELDVLDRGVRRDPRVEVILEDLPTAEHLALFASADVCLAPSRWEGLGLHLYEAIALGLPVITNDYPPMNEVIRDGENGLLVRSRRRGKANSGIPAQRAGRPRPHPRDQRGPRAWCPRRARGGRSRGARAALLGADGGRLLER